MTLFKPSLVQIGRLDGKLYALYSNGELWAREHEGNWEEQILPKAKSKIVQFGDSNFAIPLTVRLANGSVWERIADTDWVKQVLPK